MEQFAGRIAVVTGGGTGMGRELVVQLAGEGCHVALCDMSEPAMEETRTRALDGAPAGTRVTVFVADVSDEAQVTAFRDDVASAHQTDHLNLLFNNAGIGGGGSMITDSREEWERTFGVDWGGVYLCTRAFLPMLIAGPEGHIVNTSSVNGLWASIGPATPHTAYSAAKFAVRGFTEALITDLRVNAPHVRASVVHPGHIGTDIVLNTERMHGRDSESMDDAQVDQLRERLVGMGLPVAEVSNEDLRKGMKMMGEGFRDLAPTTAAQAATIILDGVRADRWRILVGDDAVALDARVRADPEGAYEPAFWDELRANGVFNLLGR